MKTFEYKGFAADGQHARGLVEALNPKAAREQLAAQGILAERLSPTGRPRPFRADQRAAFYRELAALLQAGLPMVRALDMLIRSAGAHGNAGVLAGMRDRVREGQALAQALAGTGASVSSFEVALIEAGELAGTLGGMLGRLSEFLDEQAELRERVQRALIYPALVVLVGIGVGMLMMGLLVPRAQAMLSESGQPLPALTRAMLAIGSLGAHWGLVFLAGLVVAVLALRRRLARDEAFRSAWDQRLFRLPLWGGGYARLCTLRFARTYAILLRGGVALVDGLRLAGRATGSPWLTSRTEREAETVRHGCRLSEALSRIPVLAGPLVGWVQVGEESGDVAGLLEHAGMRAADAWNRYVSRSLAVLEPLLLLIIGSFVLLVTLSVLLPILSISRSVSLP